MLNTNSREVHPKLLGEMLQVCRLVFSPRSAGGDERQPFARETSIGALEDCLSQAINKGFVDVAQALLRVPGVAWTERHSLQAARRGQIGLLRWARAQGEPCPWVAALHRAVAEGEGNILEWLRGLSAAGNDLRAVATGQDLNWVIWLGGLNGEYPRLRWPFLITSVPCHMEMYEWLATQATDSAHLELIQFLRAHDAPVEP
jgi:hypothetical protein